MTCLLHVAWDDRLTRYDFGAGHPMAPARVKLTIELARSFGVLGGSGVTTAAPLAATGAELGLVHDPGYIEMVTRAGHWAADTAAARGAEPAGHHDPAGLRRAALRFGLGTEDDPIFPDMHEASALAAGATLAAARAVWSGEAEHGASIAGGLHHAMRSRAAGFCVYNDPAIAIAWLLEHGAGRIAYVDIDVHHGDGVQAAFWDDPRVLTISLHQHPATLFPGTGLPAEAGGPRAAGSAANIALPAGTGSGTGCAPSTPSCRRCSASSGPRSWSASTAATRTGATRWPNCKSALTPSAPPTPRSTPWPTTPRAAAGC